MVRFGGIRIKPTGFAGKAFTGGISKGFMDARDARIAQANFEREQEIKEEQNRIQAAYYKSKTDEEQKDLDYNKKVLDTQGKISTRLQLLSKNPEGGPAKLNDYYYHIEGTNGQSAGELAYLRNNDLLQAITAGGAKAEQLKFSIQQNPDAWKAYYMDNYNAMTDFTMPEKDSDESVGYYVRTKPLPGSNVDDKLKHAPLFELIAGLQDDVTKRNDQVIEQFGGTNQLKTDGTMSYLKYNVPASDGSGKMVTRYAFYKNGQPMDTGVDIPESQAKTLIESGYLNSQAWKNSTFADKIQVIKALNDLGQVDDADISLAYLMNNESEVLGLDHIKASYSTIGSDSPAMLEFAAKINQVGQKILQGDPNLPGGNGIVARETLGLGLAAATFIGATDKRDVNALSNRVYDIQIAGNKITVKKKNGLQIADDTVIRTAGTTVSTANKGIKLAKSILEDQEIIEKLNVNGKYDFALQGNILGGTFDKTVIIKTVLDDIPALVSNIFGMGKGAEETESFTNIVNGKEFRELRNAAASGDVDAQVALDKANEAGQIYLSNMKKLNNYIANADSNEEKTIYQARARMEAKKVRLAFQVASLVQGGGTGGGRTISNADFEFIYNSLYGKTSDTFKQNIQDVMHDLSREKVMSLIIQRYGSTGQHIALLNGVGSYMDASYGLSQNRKYVSGEKRTMPEGVDGGTSATDTNAAIGATSTSAMSDMDSIKRTENNFPRIISNLGDTTFKDKSEVTVLLPKSNENQFQYRRRITPIVVDKIITPAYDSLTRANGNIPPLRSQLEKVIFNKEGFGLAVHADEEKAERKREIYGDMIDNFYENLRIKNLGIDTTRSGFQQIIDPLLDKDPEANVARQVTKIGMDLGFGGDKYGPGTAGMYDITGFFQKNPQLRTREVERVMPVQAWYNSKQAQEYFKNSGPDVLAMATEDPINFYYDYIAPKQAEGQ